MPEIEEIWERANDRIDEDFNFDEKFIQKSLTESSISISQKILNVLWLGIVGSFFSLLGLSYNVFFYNMNTSMLCAICCLVIFSIAAIAYFFSQLKRVKYLIYNKLSLKESLAKKLNYLKNQFQIVKHFTASTAVVLTFIINLTIENRDGIFELRKILILSVFYTFAYFLIIIIFRITSFAYTKQLNETLHNLDEKKFASFSIELKKLKRTIKYMALIFAILFLFGVILFLIKTGLF